MDSKKPNTNESATSGKNNEKKDENFITKTAHSIRDKVQEFTDDVKEKTQNLKKGKKDKDRSKSSRSPTGDKNTSGSDSDDEDKHGKPSSTDKKDIGKSDTSTPKPSSTVLTTEKKDAPAPVGASSNKPTEKPSDNRKDVAPSSSKPSNTNTITKSSTDKPANTGNNTNTTGGSSTQRKTSEQVHISFDDIVTVDDLLKRIDEAITRAKIVVRGGSGDIPLKIHKSTPTPSAVDFNKNPLAKLSDEQNKIGKKENENTNKESGEPICLDYNEIHTVQDLLRQVQRQPGSRKIVLENAPEISDDVEQKLDSSSNTQLTTKSSNENNTDNNDSSEQPKNLLKTSQDPSSLDTSTKTALFQDDKIHVNIEGIKSVDDLLDRIDDAVQNVPVVLDTKGRKDKTQYSQAPNKGEDKSQQIANTSVQSEKREAPKIPSSTNDQRLDEKSSETKPATTGEKKDDKVEKQKSADDKHFEETPSATKTGEKKDDATKAKDGKVPVFKIPEHEYGQNEDNKPAPSAAKDGKKDDMVEKKKLADDKHFEETPSATKTGEKKDATKAKDGKVPVFKIPEREYGQNEESKPTTSASKDEKTKEDETVWI